MFFFKKETSVVNVIPKFIKKKYLSKIVEELIDPREIFEVAGKYFKYGEESLARQVAKKINCNYTSKINTELIDDYYNHFPIVKLKKLGIFPIASQSSVDLIAAVDPYIARHELKVSPNYPITLACWKNIKSAWNIVENEYLQKQSLQSDNKFNKQIESLENTTIKTEEQDLIKILLIDDSNVFFQVLKFYLKGYNYSFYKYNNSRKAISEFFTKKIKPDIIICDLHMPDLNGLEVLKQLRSNQDTAQIPFLLLTSDMTIDSKLELIAAGADAYICKNEDPRLISVQIKSLLTRHQQCSLLR